MDLRLTGKVALITGASRGLGAASARLFAAEGAHLVLTARDGETLEATASAIRAASNVQVVTTAEDLVTPGATDRIQEFAVDAFGRIDILVNSAGAAFSGNFSDISDAVWKQSFDLKFFATVSMIRAVLTVMRAQKYGRIVTIVGNAGRQPGPRSLPGSSANAALLAITSGLAKDVVEDGIFINAVNPGPTMTDRWTGMLNDLSAKTGRSFDDLKGEVEDGIPTGRFSDPEEIALAVAFLASDCTGNITGTSITCDGGMTQAIA
jgi:NAD(P)-dependent dehydrogenase (short-subunit alcohol dehydrogenase family)